MKQKLFFAIAMVAALMSCKKSPSASFNLKKSNFYLTESVVLTNNATNASSYDWDFGDGSSSTEKNPKHTYKSAGSYQIKLTVNGSSSITKTVKIYPGTSSYEVQNNASIAIDLVSFATTTDDEIIDFVEHGTLQPNAKTDTVFTSDASIILGGYLNGKAFFVVNPYPMTKFAHSVVALTNQSQIYIDNSSIESKGIQSLLHKKTNQQPFKNIQ